MAVSPGAVGILVVVFCLVPDMVHSVAPVRMVGRKPLAGLVECLAARPEYGGLSDRVAAIVVVYLHSGGTKHAKRLLPSDNRL